MFGVVNLNLGSLMIFSAEEFTLFMKASISKSSSILSGTTAISYFVLETFDRWVGSDGMTGGEVGPPKLPKCV